MTRKRSAVSARFCVAAAFVAVLLLLGGFYAGVSLNENDLAMVKKTFNVGDKAPFSDDLRGFSKVNPKMDGNILVLEADCSVLSFGVTQDQAFSIQRGLESVIENRPLTHDTMVDIFDNYDVEILSIKINTETNGIYQALVTMRQGSNILNLDMRPSDATALAVRKGIQMYVSDDIMERFGENTCGEL